MSVANRLTNRPARPSTDRGEHGTSLIEIMVVLLILSIILPIIAMLLNSVQTDAITVASRQAASGQAQVIDEALSRQIHAANYPTGTTKTLGGEIVTANANELKFYSSMGDTNGPRLIDIYTALACTGCTYYNLDESYVVPNATSNPYNGTPVVQVLGTGLVLPSSTTAYAFNCPSSGANVPIFEYFDSSGTCLQTSTIITTANPPMALPASEFASIDSVTVTLTTLDTNRSKNSPEPVFTFSISMPNVDFANA
jgi:type II secretory pathway pseudopilin PulG